MPRVEITRDNSSLKTAGFTTASGASSGGALSNIGDTISAAADKQWELEQDAQARIYIANETIRTSLALEDLEQNLKSQYNDEIKSGARRDYSNFGKDYSEGARQIYAGSLDNSPNQRSIDALTNLYSNKFPSIYAHGRVTENTENISLYTAQVEQNMNGLANRLVLDPNAYQEVSQQFEALVKAAPSFMSPSDAAELANRGKENLAGAFLTGIARTAPDRLEQVASSPEMQSLLSPKVLNAALEQADMEKRKRLSEIQSAQSAAHRQYLDAQLDGIVQGSIGLADLEQSYENKQLSTREYLSLKKHFSKQIAAETAHAEQMSFVDDILAGSTVANPSLKTEREALDTYFEDRILPKSGTLSPQEFENEVNGFMNKTGYVPKAVKATLTGIHSGDPDTQAALSARVLHLAEAHPEQIKQFKKEFDVATKLNESLKAGLTPEQASESIKNFLTKKETPEYQTNLERYKKSESELDPSIVDQSGKFNKFVRAISPFGGADTDELEVPVDMTTDWETAKKHAIVDMSLSEDSATEYADKIIKQSWGITEIGSKTKFLKNPPEKIYSNATGDSTWIKDQFNTFVTKLGHDPDNVEIAGNPLIGPKLDGKETMGYPLVKRVGDTIVPLQVKSKTTGKMEAAYWVVEPYTPNTDEAYKAKKFFNTSGVEIVKGTK